MASLMECSIPRTKTVQFSDDIEIIPEENITTTVKVNGKVEMPTNLPCKSMLKNTISETEFAKIQSNLQLSKERLNAFFFRDKNQTTLDELSICSKSRSEFSFSLSTADSSSEEKEQKKSSALKTGCSGKLLFLPFPWRKKHPKCARRNSSVSVSCSRSMWMAKSVTWFDEGTMHEMERVSLYCEEEKLGTNLILQSIEHFKFSSHRDLKHHVVLQDVTQYGLGPLYQFEWFPDHPALRKPWSCIHILYVDTCEHNFFHWNPICCGKKQESAAAAHKLKSVAMEIEFEDIDDLLTVFWGLYELIPRSPKTTVSESTLLQFMKRLNKMS